jgi:ATP-dependent Clp protease ATP-binding subunit ClpC
VRDHLGASTAQVIETEGMGTAAASSHLPFAVSTKNALVHALEESVALRVPYIGTEHLLLGLMREDCAGSRILRTDVPGGLEQVRGVVLALIEQRAGSPEEARDARSVAGSAAPGGSSSSSVRLRGILSSASAGGDRGGQLPPPLLPDDPVVARPELAEALTAALGRPERNNVLLIGPPGSGKTALVRGLRRALKEGGGGLGALAGRELLELGLPWLSAGAHRPALSADRPGVALDDLDVLMAGGGADGVPRLAAGLLDLAQCELPLIVAGTEEARRKLLDAAPALGGHFEPIAVPPADVALCVHILHLLLPELGRRHGVVIDTSAVLAAIRLVEAERATGAGRRVLPGAAVDLLDAAAARMAPGRRGGDVPVVRPEHLRAPGDAA